MVKKLGPHVMSSTPIMLGQPPVAKIVNPDLAALQDLRARVGPRCLIVVRWIDDSYALIDGVHDANIWFARHIQGREGALVALKPILFEGLNEVSDSQAREHAWFELRRLDFLHSVNLNGGVISAGVGCPDFPTWQEYGAVLSELKEGDAVCLHEYWTDHADIFNPYHVLRFDKVPQLRDIPKVLTECGRDVVEGQGRAGYRLTTNDEGFLDDLRRLDALIAPRPDILGACVFTLGDDPRWVNFRVDELWPKVVAEMEQAPAPQPPPAPEPPVVLPPISKPFAWDGRCCKTVADFQVYLKNLDHTWLSQVTTCYIHHTTGLTKDWQGETSMLGLRAWWASQPGWDAGPHVIVAPDGIWIATPPTQDGIGVTDHNRNALHVETVGNYDIEPLSTDMGVLLAQTLGALGKYLPHGVKFLPHSASEATNCPGKNLLLQLPGIIWLADPFVCGPLPEEEPTFDWHKVIWWCEEADRKLQDNDKGCALAILRSLVTWIGREQGAP